MKIILLGNAGAGKSTMAKRLITGRDGQRLSLDEIAWLEGVQRRPLRETYEILEEFVQKNKEWVIEGCYGELVAEALPYCDELRFLNPGVEVCVRNCLKRPWEPEKFATEEEQHANLNNLIAWVREYESRADDYGLQFHRGLYERFEGTKREYTNLNEYEVVK